MLKFSRLFASRKRSRFGKLVSERCRFSWCFVRPYRELAFEFAGRASARDPRTGRKTDLKKGGSAREVEKVGVTERERERERKKKSRSEARGSNRIPSRPPLLSLSPTHSARRGCCATIIYDAFFHYAFRSFSRRADSRSLSLRPSASRGNRSYAGTRLNGVASADGGSFRNGWRASLWISRTERRGARGPKEHGRMNGREGRGR